MSVKQGLKLNQLCVEVPNTRKEGQTGIYRSSECNGGDIVSTEAGQPKTMYEVAQYAFKNYPQRNSFGKRVKNPDGTYGPYEWITYAEAEKIHFELASCLVYLMKNEVKHDVLKNKTVGIFSANRPEWVLTDIALISQSMINVSLFDTYGQEVLEYVINHAEVSIVVSSQERISRLLKSAGNLKSLKVIISMDPFENQDKETSSGNILKSWAASCGIKLMDFNEALSLGRAHPTAPNPPTPEDIYTYCYTSGTTGKPKGAIITHLANTSVGLAAYKRSGLNKDDEEIVYFSYLPLPHCYERSSLYSFIYSGAEIGFYCGDITKLIDDCQALKPTAMNSVPRLLNRIYDGIAAKGLHAQGLGPALFRIAYQKKYRYYKEGNGVHHPFWDTLVFNKVKQVLGGRLKFMITGSAPLSPKVMEFLRITLCLNITEGFGSTETCAGALLTVPGDNEAGACGPPLVCNEFKLIDVPSMNYKSTDKPYPRGEICLRGHNIFKGYLNEPEKTREALDEDGWFHTGDIAALNKYNFPMIIDRIKNIFKLSQGEYISPEKIENVYVANTYVMQAFIYGDSLQDKLVAIIVPDPETFVPWALTKTSLKEKPSLKELCGDEKINQILMIELNKAANDAKLSGFEKVFAIHLEPEPFTIENGLVTPTLKPKRHELKVKYQEEINRLYEKLNK